MRSLHTPVRAREFVPEKGSPLWLSVEDARGYAYGKLCVRLQRVAWDAAMDERPRAQDTIAFLRDVTREDWMKNPEAALAALWQREQEREEAMLAIRRQAPADMPADVLAPKAHDARYGHLLEIYGRYVTALRHIPRLVERFDMADIEDPLAYEAPVEV